jgi:hypothetical protein
MLGTAFFTKASKEARCRGAVPNTFFPSGPWSKGGIKFLYQVQIFGI